MNDKPYSDSDDCIIADDFQDSNENWHLGQLVWAALKGYSFRPAIIFMDSDGKYEQGKITVSNIHILSLLFIFHIFCLILCFVLF